MLRREGPVERRPGERRQVDLDDRHVDLAGLVETLAPHAFAVAVQRDRKTRGLGNVVRIDVQLDLDAIRKVLARLVEHHMAARHEEQPAIALEEEAAGVGQPVLLLERGNAGGGEENGFDHEQDSPADLAPALSRQRPGGLGSGLDMQHFDRPGTLAGETTSPSVSWEAWTPTVPRRGEMLHVKT